MGCNSSKLTGDENFNSIDATPNQGMPWKSKKTTSDPKETIVSQEAYSHTTRNISPVNDESGEDLSSSKPSQNSTTGAPESEGELLIRMGMRKPILRTDQDRMQPDPVTGKKPGMYQKLLNRRLGPGEGEFSPTPRSSNIY